MFILFSRKTLTLEANTYVFCNELYITKLQGFGNRAKSELTAVLQRKL